MIKCNIIQPEHPLRVNKLKVNNNEQFSQYI